MAILVAEQNFDLIS